MLKCEIKKKRQINPSSPRTNFSPKHWQRFISRGFFPWQILSLDWSTRETSKLFDLQPMFTTQIKSEAYAMQNHSTHKTQHFIGFSLKHHQHQTSQPALSLEKLFHSSMSKLSNISGSDQSENLRQVWNIWSWCWCWCVIGDSLCDTVGMSRIHVTSDKWRKGILSYSYILTVITE